MAVSDEELDVLLEMACRLMKTQLKRLESGSDEGLFGSADARNLSEYVRSIVAIRKDRRVAEGKVEDDAETMTAEELRDAIIAKAREYERDGKR